MRNVYYKNRKDRLRIDRGEDVARAYSSWSCMRDRIRNPLRCKSNGVNYVGLTISEEWDDFERFLADMGSPPKNHSIDRIDNCKGYNKENCRWSNEKVQARNRLYVRLNEEAAKVIRYFYHEKGYSQQRIANVYGVTQVLVGQIVRNKAWVI